MSDSDIKLTFVSLKDYFDAKINSLREFTDLHFRLSAVAIEKTEEKIDIRLHSLNGLTQILKDQNVNFVTKSEHEAIRKEINNIYRLVYIGVGIIITIEFLFKYLH